MTIYSPDFCPITSYPKEYLVMSRCPLISEALFFSSYNCGFSHDCLCHSSVDQILLFVLHTRTHLLDAVSSIYAPMVSLRFIRFIQVSMGQLQLTQNSKFCILLGIIGVKGLQVQSGRKLL